MEEHVCTHIPSATACGRTPTWRSAVWSPVFPKNLHAEVSLSKMLNPELPLIEQQSAANTTVWMCVWLGECKNCTVKSFKWSSRLEKRYINTNPFTIYIYAWIIWLKLQ